MREDHISENEEEGEKGLQDHQGRDDQSPYHFETEGRDQSKLAKEIQSEEEHDDEWLRGFECDLFVLRIQMTVSFSPQLNPGHPVKSSSSNQE